MAHKPGITLLAAALVAAPAFGQSSRISEDVDSFTFNLNGLRVTIDRSGPSCPPSCLQPMVAAPGVTTIAELEILDFLDLFVGAGQGLLMDTRLPELFAAGTLPGAVNVPGQTLGPTNPYRDDLLTALGVRNGDFSAAFDLVIFAGGADAPEAPLAVRSLIDAGYPASKLKYYRGGVASWQGYGLTTVPGR